MRIDLNSGVGQTGDSLPLSKSNPRSSAPGARDEAPTDAANLSPDYQRVRDLVGVINGLPEIRQDKVAALAGMIENGTYGCTPEQTAKALLSHMATTVNSW